MFVVYAVNVKTLSVSKKTFTLFETSTKLNNFWICSEDDLLIFFCIRPWRPGACYYFVHREDLNHENAIKYCALNYNARLASFADENTQIELVKAYYWWTERKTNQLFRMGAGFHPYKEAIGNYNFSDCPIRNTGYTFANYGIDVDENIWRKVFCPDMKNDDKPCTTHLYYKQCEKELKLDMADKDDFSRVKINHQYRYIGLNMDTGKAHMISFLDTYPFICESPRYPKAFCEEGWKLHMRSRSCFAYSKKTRLLYDKALEECRSLHSSLASINDQGEWDFVRRLENRPSKTTWFGLRYIPTEANPDAPMEERRKHFWEISFNVDGSKSTVAYNHDYSSHSYETYPGWDPYQPQTLKTENCLVYMDEFNWHDFPCDMDSFQSVLCRKMSDQIPDI